MPIVEPKIKEVTDQMDFSSGSILGMAYSLRSLFQPLHEFSLSHQAFCPVGSTQMQVRSEVDVLQTMVLWKQFLQLGDQCPAAQVRGDNGALLVD